MITQGYRDLARKGSLHEELDEIEGYAVEAARLRGMSWEDLASRMRVTSRQAALQRFQRLTPRRDYGPGRLLDEQAEKSAVERALASWAAAPSHAAELRRVASAVLELPGIADLAQERKSRIRYGQDRVDSFLNGLLSGLGDKAVTLLPDLKVAKEVLAEAHPELAARIQVLVRAAYDVEKSAIDQRRKPRSRSSDH